MKHLKIILITLIFTTTTYNCEQDTTYLQKVEDPELFHSAMKKLTDIIVYDIFSPPVASRVYAYPSIAAYEVIRFKSPEKYVSLAGQLSGLTPIEAPSTENIQYNIAAIYAFIEVGKTLIFSEEKMIAFQQSFEEKLKTWNAPKKMINESKAFGHSVSTHILKWMKKDLYDQTRTYPKYTILQEEKFWKPTPPDYMDGIEPHWNQIRTFVLDSANQFAPIPPVPFSLNPKSSFYKQLKEVQDVTENLTEEQTEIAKFWDCNPYVSHHRGHAMFATKKITPGGHWIGITSIATRQANQNFINTIDTYAKVSISLFDAFISCWDEKWNSVLVRPETLINQHFDEEWVPLLQTPPFPEYTSGHSVISRAAAVTLTSIFGDNFQFEDTTEMEYGLPMRRFNSFIHASEEAAISRLYGGIHYRMAIEEGVSQGQNVGEFIVSKLKTKK